MVFAVTHSHGLTEKFSTYEEAIAAIDSIYSDVVVGHPNDITEGGPRTLCWTSQDDADNNDGSRACCVVTKQYAEGESP